jgi:membrane associated rhomboid family serine protease
VYGLCWHCAACGGRALGIAVLRKTILNHAVNEVWRAAQDHHGTPGRPCPACGTAMREVTATSAQPNMHVDVCTCCAMVWFDAAEYEALPAAPVTRPAEPELPPAAREALAMLKVKAIAEHARTDGHDDAAPDSALGLASGLLGFPVETDAPGTSGTPWLTWGLALLTVLISGYALIGNPGLIAQFGMIPATPWRYGGITFLSAFFLHGGLMHLAGNIYYLLIFGDNVEDALGRARYALLILLATLMGNVLHLASQTSPSLPCIGASGGIAGIMVFYALAFPQARFSVFIRWHWFQLSALYLVLFWVLMQLIGAWQQISGFSNVSAFAHLGGACIGLACWLYWRQRGTGQVA